jgi:hypothetical protein
LTLFVGGFPFPFGVIPSQSMVPTLNNAILEKEREREKTTTTTTTPTTGWRFGTFFYFSIIYGMSSFPLTNSIIFQDG